MISGLMQAFLIEQHRTIFLYLCIMLCFVKVFEALVNITAKRTGAKGPDANRDAHLMKAIRKLESQFLKQASNIL